jgi:hypothetical protein
VTTYSALNVATVVRDLAGHPHGAAVTDALLQAFALDADTVVELDRVALAPAAGRQRAAALAASRPVPAATVSVGGAAAQPAGVGVLDQVTIGGATDLCEWVADEVLAPAWDRVGDLAVCRTPRAIRHVTDGLLAAWLGGDPRQVGALGEPWRAWTAAHDRAVPADTDLRVLLVLLEHADPGTLAGAADALNRLRSTGWSWSLAMHDACWALELTGRGRDVAIAQLGALHALLGTTPRPRPDLVAAVTAAVHATAVADVLPSADVAAMRGPLFDHRCSGSAGSVPQHGRGDG